MKARLLVAALCVGLVGCAHAPGLSSSDVEKLKASDGYVCGDIAELKDYALLDNKDFSYSIGWARDGEHVAYSHLAAHYYQLGLWKLGPPPSQLANVNVNGYEYDVESLDFSPDGRTVVTASRDGVIRFFDSATGAARGAYATDEPLVSVAFHPSGRYVVSGSARGLLTVIRFPELSFDDEQRLHDAEVRAIVFADDGRMWSGGWDKKIIPFDTLEKPYATDTAFVHYEQRGGFYVVRASVSDKVSAAFALDGRSPLNIVSSEVAKTAGIDVAMLQDTATIPTPMGTQLVKVIKAQTLGLKSIRVPGVDLAVCDNCLPAETQGVLGRPFADLVDVTFKGDTREAVFKTKAPPGEPRPTLVLKAKTPLSMPWFVNDLSLDRAGRHLGVAFSEVPAQRTREIYEREKKKLVEPAADGNAAAIVDAESGQILKKWTHHNGVVASVGISPDGTRVISGGWDKQLYVFQEGELTPKIRRSFGWSVRRVRFSRDGRYVAVAAWTPQNPLGDQTSDPSAVVFEILYSGPRISRSP